MVQIVQNITVPNITDPPRKTGKFWQRMIARSLLLALLLWVGRTGQAIANPEPIAPTSALQSFDDPRFWTQARRLLAERLYLLATTRQALTLPDPVAIADLDFQLYRHLILTRRFQAALSSEPAALCHQTTTTEPPHPAQLDPAKKAVYCSLIQTNGAIDALFEPLSQQQAEILRLTPLSAQQAAWLTVPGTTSEPGRLLEPNTNRGSFDPTDTPLPGVTAKPPAAQVVRFYTPPAYAPPPSLVGQLTTIIEQLTAVLPNLPAGLEIVPPQEAAERRDRWTYELATYEYEVYADFLALPNTGLARLLPGEVIRQQPNPVGNRVLEAREVFMPLQTPLQASLEAPLQAPLNPTITDSIETINPINSFVPRLLLEVANNQLTTVSEGLDYGFVVDLGDVDLAGLSFADLSDFAETFDTNSPINSLTNSSASLQTDLQAAIAYRPPDRLDLLQADRQRVRLGKTGALGVTQGVATTLPLVMNHTYLLRSIQFALPDFILTGRSLRPTEREQLASQLEIPSADLLIAVRPVAMQLDGSYTVQWQILAQFPNPQIIDLYNYVNYGDSRSPSW